MASKKVYAIKSPKGNPVRCEEAWKDANGNVIADTYETKQNSEDTWATRKAQEEKCYQALKTVTKDFTRTDPVYVRIGEDGEPEIHYTMTQADGNSYFANMDLGNATLYVHNGAVLTNCTSMFLALYAKRIFLDSVGSCTSTNSLFSKWPIYELNNTIEIGLFDTHNITEALSMFYWCSKLEEIPAYDFSSITSLGLIDNCHNLKRFKPTGIKCSFSFVEARALAHDGILEIFNNLGSDVAEGTTLTLGSAKLALMSDDEKKIATDKGWTLA